MKVNLLETSHLNNNELTGPTAPFTTTTYLANLFVMKIGAASLSDGTGVHSTLNVTFPPAAKSGEARTSRRIDVERRNSSMVNPDGSSALGCNSISNRVVPETAVVTNQV